ncbi:hypothetical protein BIY37_06410 [Candidatus Brocadia sapporoensis]|uniref:Uncharacterized protein n=1 Tax=Candidatus Brocadia sapporoensis TaxID=392547 RepID=A0A1V6M0B4_9BACT|nr:hypothetical protein BIY37_06410 [Candidatus Brocadia sapporoensis]
MKLTMPGGDVNHGFCLFEFPFQFWVWRSVVNPVVPRAAAFPQTCYLFSCPIELLFFINLLPYGLQQTTAVYENTSVTALVQEI